MAIALCACVLTTSMAWSAHADSGANFDLPALMHGLAQVRTTEGTFVERKYLSILSEPLVLRGRVRYRAPNFVRKEYDEPEGESYEVDGDSLTIELSDGRQRELSVDEHPVLRAFVESYRGTLAGDLETLRRYFDLKLDGREEDWLLRLKPREPTLAEYLSEVVMLGRSNTIYSVETLEAGGDRSVMTVDITGE